MNTDGSNDLIPIFPLANVVLFPKVRTPLYIFEPRYRQMTRHALSGDKRIGMVVVRPEHTDDMLGDPPIFPIGCEGVITQHQEQPDGTFHIVLLGTRRFVSREEPERPSDVLFRSARVQGLEDLQPESDRERIALMRREVFEQLSALVERMPDRNVAAPNPQTFVDVDDETLVNALCQSIDFGAAEKQGLLEAESIRERFERLTGLLRFRLAATTQEDESGPRTLH